ncbi:MAG: metal ABC transporter permease [Actinobacteria bacterium]|nr:MAG: metal ABC transporter permease [Actinomycetota bacterium]
MTFIRYFWPALIAAAVVGAAAPAIGTFLVQRRLSLIGDGVGHIALAGVAIGLWLKISPLAAALGFSVLGAVGIDRLRRRAPDESDMALALFFYGSIAVAVVVASRTGNFNVNLFGFLFGQVLTVTRAELLTIGILGAFVIAGRRPAARRSAARASRRHSAQPSPQLPGHDARRVGCRRRVRADRLVRVERGQHGAERNDRARRVKPFRHLGRRATGPRHLCPAGARGAAACVRPASGWRS